ncbi:hypothetical protein SAMN04488125_12849 [Methylorubrum salsuginis]|uniref:Uncharacterized protein n=1 Tax=Methylorubrum salsuginis TaxID=414703 RepID=A0A1I4LAD9_9HYPH|nr:hypothetical protein SAMN04488125_12849 [Methylorubrum salsuginis]
MRVNPQRVSFPDQSQHYLIVHPHFDEYEDHIRWYGEVVRPLTDKGIKLTQMCNLHRFGLLKVGEKVLPINSHADNIVGKFMDPHASPLELDMALAAFTVYVKSVPQA